MCARPYAREPPSSVPLPWLPSSPASSTAGSSRRFRLLWPLEAECLSITPGIRKTQILCEQVAGTRVCVTSTKGTLVPWLQGRGRNGTSRVGAGGQKRSEEREDASPWVCKGGVPGGTGQALVHR